MELIFFLSTWSPDSTCENRIKPDGLIQNQLVQWLVQLQIDHSLIELPIELFKIIVLVFYSLFPQILILFIYLLIIRYKHAWLDPKSFADSISYSVLKKSLQNLFIPHTYFPKF